MKNFVSTYRNPLVVAAAAVFISTVFSADRTLLDTSILVAIYSLMAVSLGLAFGQAGIMSLGQASFAAIGAYATAIVTTRFEMSPLIGLVAAIAIPAIIAYPFARLTVRLSHLALALATLFLGEIVVIVLAQGGDFTGGYIGLGGVPMIEWAVEPATFNLLAWSFVVLALVLYTNLMRTSGGRALNTLRHDKLRAQADGDNGPRRLSAVFALAAAMCGAAGWLYAHYLTYLAPESLSSLLSISLLLMVIVGGSRYIIGPVVGAAVLTILNENVPQEIQGAIYGTALVVILLVAPNGVLGLLVTAKDRLFPAHPHRTTDGTQRDGTAAPVREEVEA